MFTISFWKDALERAIKSAAAAAIIALGLVKVGAFNALTTDWVAVAGISLGGFILSVLMSISSAPLGDKGTASLVKTQPGGIDPGNV